MLGKLMSYATKLLQERTSRIDGLLTVNTANATVPMMKPSELLNFSIAGGFSPCCVKDVSHFGRAMLLRSKTSRVLYHHRYDFSRWFL